MFLLFHNVTDFDILHFIGWILSKKKKFNLLNASFGTTLAFQIKKTNLQFIQTQKTVEIYLCFFLDFFSSTNIH